jgi:hypothetical protein
VPRLEDKLIRTKHVAPLALLGTILVASCGGRVESDLGAADQDIVNATAEGGHDQVVLVHTTFLSGRSLYTRTCSGTLIGPRVVLTAAHCLEDVWNDQVFAYWGDDFDTDFDALPTQGPSVIPPPVGQPSVFAQAESYTQHPDYDPELHHPDLGLIYLDREPPFAPLPLAHFKVGSWLEGSTVTVQGWGVGEVVDDELLGGRIQRTGEVTLLGSPTEDDFDETDPNLGLLDPAIRAQQLKTDGTAPNSNTCAGDSGGPLLIDQGAGDVVAGVTYFGDVGCDDYALYVRTYPFEEGYIGDGLDLGGSRPIQPQVECIVPNEDGSFRAYVGYDNQNLVSLDVPLEPGWRNMLNFDEDERRPTHFEPGNHPIVFSVEVPRYQTLVWQLVPENGWGASTVANAWTTPECTGSQLVQASCVDWCTAQEVVACEDVPTTDECVASCVEFADFAPECEAEYLALNVCEASMPADGWECDPGYGVYSTWAYCEEEAFAFDDCLFGSF